MEWEYVFGDRNDLAAWDGPFFIHVNTQGDEWSWLVTNLSGIYKFGTAPNIEEAKKTALNITHELKSEL